MAERRLPTREEVDSYLWDRSNWRRWGKDDEVGAINLITPQKRMAAAGLVRNGRVVSLSRYFPKAPGPGNPNPAQHWMQPMLVRGTGGAAMDYYGISYHGSAATHLDALCHVWNENGMWNGRDPAKEITLDGAKFGSVDRWSDGIITRGVLLDIPKHRGEPYVTYDRPVHGWELEEVAKAQGVTLEPGDALVVYSGRDALIEAHPHDHPYLAVPTPAKPIPERPGLHVSCLPFIRDNDVSVLIWDMMDFAPNGYDIPWSVHGVIFAYGVALVDNALLQPLAEICAQEGRYEFMVIIAPLKVAGGTGSPVNPIALL
jgi:kynurenine formamidase